MVNNRLAPGALVAFFAAHFVEIVENRLLQTKWDKAKALFNELDSAEHSGVSPVVGAVQMMSLLLKNPAVLLLVLDHPVRMLSS